MIIEKAYAKINLFLNVTGKRTDGYHNIESIMASINLYDTLEFQVGNEIVITSDKEITKDIHDNLVYKIAMHLKKSHNVTKGVHIHIKKNIPMGAGLAGGSADAAATLRGLNKLWNLGLSLDELAKIGFMFGSDIPYCVYNKIALAEGRGEKLTFLKSSFRTNVIVINPNIHVSTKEIFGKVKDKGFENRSYKQMIEAIKNNNFNVVCNEMYNSFETIVFEISPKIEKIKLTLQTMGFKGVLMSGSGSTVYALTQNSYEISRIKNNINKDYFIQLTHLT